MTDSVQPLTMEEVKEYLEIIDDLFCKILVDRSIFQDFHNALIEQKARNNLFINWVAKNYYNILVLNLCKLLEPRKTDSNKYTLKNFINSIKDPNNYNMLEDAMRKSQIDIHDIGTGAIKKRSIGDQMLKTLYDIDFKADLECVEKTHAKLTDFRNKRLCHNSKECINEIVPTIEELHLVIDRLEEMFVKYFHLCRLGIDYRGIKGPNRYNNFILHLK